jgi:hypothetical protein
MNSWDGKWVVFELARVLSLKPPFTTLSNLGTSGRTEIALATTSGLLWRLSLFLKRDQDEKWLRSAETTDSVSCKKHRRLGCQER